MQGGRKGWKGCSIARNFRHFGKGLIFLIIAMLSANFLFMKDKNSRVLKTRKIQTKYYPSGMQASKQDFLKNESSDIIRPKISFETILNDTLLTKSQNIRSLRKTPAPQQSKPKDLAPHNSIAKKLPDDDLIFNMKSVCWGKSTSCFYMPDNTVQYRVQTDIDPLGFVLDCKPSNSTQHFRAIELTVEKRIEGTFTVALQDWLGACGTDWHDNPLTTTVRGEPYGVQTADGPVVYYIPIADFQHRMSTRIRSIRLLGFKRRPANVSFLAAKITNRPPPAGWQAPELETFARAEYFCRQPGVIALCIDDGNDKNLERVLDQLKVAGAPATFFQVGRFVARSERRLDFARRALQEGHTIGHHTWNHDDMSEMGEAEMRRDLDATLEQHERHFHQHMKYFRPPRGRLDAILQRELAARNMTNVMWTYTLSDYGAATNETIWGHFLGHMARFRPEREGLLSVQHFSVNASVDLIPRMVETGRRHGWRFVTLDECLAPSGGGPRHGAK